MIVWYNTSVDELNVLVDALCILQEPRILSRKLSVKN